MAEHLEHSHQVKIIEHSLERCTTLSERLDRTVVLHGSATSKRLLEEENIEDCDIFCALTNDDEVNIMSSLLAKRLGAKKVLTLINNAAYVDLVQGGDIDIAISPTSHHRQPADPRTPGRYRQRTLAAPGRGGGHRGDCPWR
ncbi:hypothetical protein HAALTHF_00330n [Vreelandella aquamarina]|nr:hypothetical protein HAALTHF_00330n [Halomonas axialensis]